MTQLRDHDWQYSFTSSQDNLLEGFYRPALQEAIRYWRITGYLPGVNYLGGRLPNRRRTIRPC